MNSQTVGTCSLCGGPVTLPLAWYSVTQPVATCSRCGAVAAQHGPVIPMVQPAHIPSPFGVPLAPSTGTSPGLTVDIATNTVAIGIGGPGWTGIEDCVATDDRIVCTTASATVSAPAPADGGES